MVSRKIRVFFDWCILLCRKRWDTSSRQMFNFNVYSMQKFSIVLFVCVLGFYVCRQATINEKVIGEVLLRNVEALAFNESKEPIICDFSGDLVCPNGGKKVKYVYQGYGWEPDEETY